MFSCLWQFMRFGTTCFKPSDPEFEHSVSLTEQPSPPIHDKRRAHRRTSITIGSSAEAEAEIAGLAAVVADPNILLSSPRENTSWSPSLSPILEDFEVDDLPLDPFVPLTDTPMQMLPTQAQPIAGASHPICDLSVNQVNGYISAQENDRIDSMQSDSEKTQIVYAEVKPKPSSDTYDNLQATIEELKTEVKRLESIVELAQSCSEDVAVERIRWGEQKIKLTLQLIETKTAYNECRKEMSLQYTRNRSDIKILRKITQALRAQIRMQGLVPEDGAFLQLILNLENDLTEPLEPDTHLQQPRPSASELGAGLTRTSENLLPQVPTPPATPRRSKSMLRYSISWDDIADGGAQAEAADEASDYRQALDVERPSTPIPFQLMRS